MPYYNICELCGATLDPNEKCTCLQEKKEAEEQKKTDKMIAFTFELLQRSKRRKKK